MIRFIKILAYPQTPETGDPFAYLDELTTQRTNPPSLHPGELQVNEPVIFHSPLRRAIECLRPLPGQRIIALDGAREIPFSLSALCTRDEWERERSAIVRRRFAEAFVSDTLPITRERLEAEIKQLLEQVRGEPSAAVLSHSFRLKLLEACLKTDGLVFRRPELIHEWILPDHKTYDWGQGFIS